MKKRLLGILLALAAIAAVVAIAVVVPSGSTEENAPETAADNANVGVQGDGKLASTPDPLSLAELNRAPEGSPERAVLDLLFWAQWGDLPSIVTQYDTDVMNGLGVVNVTGAYAFLRSGLATSQPRIGSVQKNGGQTLVTVELLSTKYAPQQESFLLKRTGNGWRVVYDTLLERGLRSYVTFSKARNPDHPEQDLKAVEAGEQTAQTYRNIFASAQLNK